ncbi:bifunctional DNA primase/polymerase [Streptomyces sp. TLI_185]|uniref:bifunctional DNA primase/polymerase n=1 Tax=Streptomyces sp. TLI_185 TaxID=2485151 RepID=UPI0016111FF6|nr:bifunctional DNA primase/polymerase [Streptomyces sp. TLI_185]
MSENAGAATPGKGSGSEINNRAAASIDDTSMLPLAAAALSYAARGWRVHPLVPSRKIPLWHREDRCPRIGDCVTGHVKWTQRATTDTDTIVKWWTANPAANVSVVTGPASGVWVLDVDDKDDPVRGVGSPSLAALEREHGDLPPTYTVGTGSVGVHHYFTYEGVDFHLGNPASKLAPGLDIRAEGGQVVAPPSRVDDPKHVMAYVVLDPRPPVPAPAWLLDKLRNLKPKPTAARRLAHIDAATPENRERLAAALRRRRAGAA